ncbi:hypothetical protein BC831DRAFT_451308 [Entophlyctis helioformis]|nr:hypothetical protein BC831DRAFT_451308 [Entophlyctis helioformis]
MRCVSLVQTYCLVAWHVHIIPLPALAFASSWLTQAAHRIMTSDTSTLGAMVTTSSGQTYLMTGVCLKSPVSLRRWATSTDPSSPGLPRNMPPCEWIDLTDMVVSVVCETLPLLGRSVDWSGSTALRLIPLARNLTSTLLLLPLATSTSL